MNKLESFVENFASTSLESSESACIRRSLSWLRLQASGFSGKYSIKTTYSVFQHEQNGGEATAWAS